MSDLNMNLNSVIQSCKAKLCSNIFEAANNNFDDLNSDHWDHYPITMVVWYCWELSTDCSFASGMCADHSILPQGQPVGRMTSLLHGDHMRLGVKFMSWSNFFVLVRLSLPWRDFITLSDIIRTCGHVMDDAITLLWSRESWYDISPSWMKFSSWWDFVCLGVILHLGAINWILVWFFFALDTIFVLVRFYFFRCRFLSWCDQLHLGMIFLHFARVFRLSVILFDLVSFYILVRLTASWCDLCVLSIDIFCILVFYSCM